MNTPSKLVELRIKECQDKEKGGRRTPTRIETMLRQYGRNLSLGQEQVFFDPVAKVAINLISLCGPFHREPALLTHERRSRKLRIGGPGSQS